MKERMKPKTGIFIALAAVVAVSAPLVLTAARSFGAAPATQYKKANINWKAMSHHDQKEYMKLLVYPKMKREFAGFDPKKFGAVKCVTCHGDGVKDDSYKMPNPKLPKLPDSKEGWDKLQKEKPEILKFMSNVVKPEMAAMLGMEPWSQKNPDGFGCGNCHTSQK